jgi:hypothetical protein
MYANGSGEDLSDLLHTHQVRPTEVKTPNQGQDHHHSLDVRNISEETKSFDRGGSINGFTLGCGGHGSHQQGWGFRR